MKLPSKANQVAVFNVTNYSIKTNTDERVGFNSQCENDVRNFPPLRFYVKSISKIVQTAILTYFKTMNFDFDKFLQFRKAKISKMTLIIDCLNSPKLDFT